MELKPLRMQDEIIDLRCPDPPPLIGPVLALPGVRDASLFGAGLHIVTAEAEKTQREIARLLDQQRITGATMTIILPTMEDVFISLIEEVDRRTAADQRPEERA